MHTLEEQLALEAHLQGEMGQTRDFKEGVVAFLEKRGDAATPRAHCLAGGLTRLPGTARPTGAGGNAHLLRERPGGDLPGGNAPAEILTLP